MPIPLQGFFFGPPISDSDGDDGDDDDDDDGDDDVPTLQGPHSHLANPLLRTAHHDHDHHDHNHLSGPGPGPNSLDFPEDEDTYQYQLGYGSLGDICMLQVSQKSKIRLKGLFCVSLYCRYRLCNGGVLHYIALVLFNHTL